MKDGCLLMLLWLMVGYAVVAVFPIMLYVLIGYFIIRLLDGNRSSDI